MNLIKYNDPFSSISSFHNQLDDIFNSMFNDKNFRSISANEPKMDVYSQDDKKLIFELHTANYPKDSLTVDVKDNVLSIKGQINSNSDEDKSKNYFLKETSSSFYRRMSLPKNVDTNSITAKYDNGILRISFDFKPEAETKKVEIK